MDKSELNTQILKSTMALLKDHYRPKTAQELIDLVARSSVSITDLKKNQFMQIGMEVKDYDVTAEVEEIKSLAESRAAINWFAEAVISLLAMVVPREKMPGRGLVHLMCGGDRVAEAEYGTTGRASSN